MYVDPEARYLFIECNPPHVGMEIEAELFFEVRTTLKKASRRHVPRKRLRALTHGGHSKTWK
jgi:hypothetical protein